MAHGEGIRQVAWLDCAGGGQVVLDGDRAYIGHMDAPHGTSVVDVSDPKHPRITASVDIPPGLHSHKVRVANDLMLVNRERTRGDCRMPTSSGCAFSTSATRTIRATFTIGIVPAPACIVSRSMAATLIFPPSRKAMSARS